ncbi:DUF4402 domain-containing protein [Sphingomonas jaspsi]|uniref:DUF4402 domain-containing protein n=1 Tax=Sphingomonas jaspsi TaxID=392409 RepID=UPI0004B88654|nr:DUF4402 domain-containing protein [Sphingomonas jaspsi]
MTKFVRLAALAAAATLAATPALAAPVAASPAAKASARIVKPLTLTATRDLDFGTIVVGTLSGPQTVAVSQGGALSGCAGGLTCSGTVQSAQYKVTGTNNFTVNVTATASNLTNTTSGGNELLSFTPDAPATVALGNSGASGVNFTVGGSISIASTTVDGLYKGDINVTVDY